MARGSFYPKYVTVAERKAKAQKKANSLKKKGIPLNPITINGRTIAKTFWGKSWCTHLESFSDFDNRLSRGRIYVRNGSILDLSISRGKIEALVQGSNDYRITVEIKALSEQKWQSIIKDCSGKIDSLIELLQGKFSDGVMKVITDGQKGLFPQPNEIDYDCSCPDYASMCKHIAAVFYGVGNRLDEKPEALFLLRQINHMDLIDNLNINDSVGDLNNNQNLDIDLGALFDIDLDTDSRMKKKSKSKTRLQK